MLRYCSVFVLTPKTSIRFRRKIWPFLLFFLVFLRTWYATLGLSCVCPYSSCCNMVVTRAFGFYSHVTVTTDWLSSSHSSCRHPKKWVVYWALHGLETKMIWEEADMTQVDNDILWNSCVATLRILSNSRKTRSTLIKVQHNYCPAIVDGVHWRGLRTEWEYSFSSCSILYKFMAHCRRSIWYKTY